MSILEHFAEEEFAFWQSLQGEPQLGWTPSNSTSQALEAFRAVKSGQGLLLNFSGISTRSSSQFIQIFDESAPPASGDVPVIVFGVPAGSASAPIPFSGSFPPRGRRFYRGIQFANSSTLATYTAGSADCWFDVQYL